MKSNRFRAAMPWILLSVLLLLPLYTVSAAFAIRSGILDLNDRSIDADEYKALWAFIGSGLATAASIVGILFTRAHNERTSSQLELDTAVKSLQLLTLDDGKYAPKARVAGALSALVHLGHPLIAMRTLASVWQEGAIDSGTACWLISEVFQRGSPESKIEATTLLRQNVENLN
jgi:hypothetical protein